MELMTMAQYSVYRGVSREAVRKAIKTGRIEVIDVDGKQLIHPELADVQWQRNTNQAKAHRGEQRSPAVARVRRLALPDDDDAPAGDTIAAALAAPASRSADYQDAKARRETALAALAELELERERGRLVDRDRVRLGASQAAKLLRDSIMAQPGHLAARLATMGDPAEVERVLSAALRQVLDDAAQALGDLDAVEAADG